MLEGRTVSCKKKNSFYSRREIELPILLESLSFWSTIRNIEDYMTCVFYWKRSFPLFLMRSKPWWVCFSCFCWRKVTNNKLLGRNSNSKMLTYVVNLLSIHRRFRENKLLLTNRLRRWNWLKKRKEEKKVTLNRKASILSSRALNAFWAAQKNIVFESYFPPLAVGASENLCWKEWRLPTFHVTVVGQYETGND